MIHPEMFKVLAQKHATEFFLIACLVGSLVTVASFFGMAVLFPPRSTAFWICWGLVSVIATVRLCRSIHFSCRNGIVDVSRESQLLRLIDNRRSNLGIALPDRVIVDLSDEVAIAYVTENVLRPPELQLRIGCLCLMVLDEKEIDALISHELGHVRVKKRFRFVSWMRYCNLAMLRAWFPWFVRSFDKTLINIASASKRAEEFDCDSIAAQCTEPLTVSRALLAHAVMGYVYERRVLDCEQGKMHTDLSIFCKNAGTVCEGLSLCRDDQFLRDFLNFEAKQSVQGHHPSLLDRFQNLRVSTQDVINSFCTREFLVRDSESADNTHLLKSMQVWTS